MVGLGLRAWVGGMSLVWPLRARHVTLLALLARPTPGFKPTPMGPRPKPTPHPKPPGWWLGHFPPTHAQTLAPYPTTLIIKLREMGRELS
ncbi:hypothetical protein Hanom_Chr07g00584891 [Helianthus anomalus]